MSQPLPELQVSIGLKARLMWAFALLAVCPTLLLGGLAIRSARRDVQIEVVRGNLALIQSIGRALNATLQDTRRALSVSAAAWSQMPTAQHGQRILRSLRSEFGILRRVSLLDRLGKRLSGDDLAAGEDFSLELTNTFGGYVSDVLWSGGKQHVLLVVQARNTIGELVGFIAAMVDLSFVQQSLGEVRLGQGAALLVVDGNGRKVAWRGRLPALKWGPSARDTNPAVDQVLATHEEGHFELDDARGYPWVAIYRNIVGMNEFRGVRWGVLLLQPTANAYALARKATRDTVVVALLVLGMALAVGAWLAGRITRPLALLVQQTEMVAKEDFEHVRRVASSTTPEALEPRSVELPSSSAADGARGVSAEPAVGSVGAGLIGRTGTHRALMASFERHLFRRDEIGVLAQSFATMIQRLRQSRERLFALTEFLENLVRSIPVGVIWVNRLGAIRSMNRAQERLSLVTAESVVGRGIWQVFAGTDSPVSHQLESVLRDGVPVDVTHDNTATPFTREPCLRYRIRMAPLRDRQGQVDGAVILQEDLSERARLEAQLLRSEKLSSIGVLAAGVAHEINNPLTSILGYAKLLLEERAEDDADRPALELVAEEAQRVQEIVRNLLDFSRQDTGQRTPASLNQLLERTLSLVAPDLRKRAIAVQRELHGDLPLVHIDVRQIEQVFVNLVNNASHAMSGGGTLTVHTGWVPHREPGVFAEFSDTGDGIAEAHLARIFDPFFTTKDPGQGTGLGLAISQRIITDHGGEIEVRSKVGQGTTFRLWFLPLDG